MFERFYAKEEIVATMLVFIRRRPVLTYYLLVLLISWGGFLITIGPTLHLEVVDIPPGAILAMVAGPVVAGLLLTALVYGRAGFREMRTRLFTWRVGLRWYALALLLAPLVMGAVLFMLSLASPRFFPGVFKADDKASYLLFNLWVALTAGIVEEIGWTGFAVPTLRRRYSVFVTGAVVGLMWGTWHMAGNVSAAETVVGTLPLAVFLPLLIFDVVFGSLLPFRMLMVWVYDHTESLLLAILMHTSITASIRILSPLPNEGLSIIITDMALATAFWIIVGLIAVTTGGHIARKQAGIGAAHPTPG